MAGGRDFTDQSHYIKFHLAYELTVFLLLLIFVVGGSFLMKLLKITFCLFMSRRKQKQLLQRLSYAF